jgi:diadenosine tetraphosphate (Ap4A) HIT family hydrolase
MERTWPSDWEERKTGKDCPMCAEGRPEEGFDGSRVLASERCDAYLVRDEIARGYTVLVWRGRHVAEPTELTDEESVSFWFDTLVVCRALERHYRPAKLNLLMLGNSVPHLHTHIVPRYVHDPDPGRPLGFMGRDSEAPPFPRIPEEDYAQDVAVLKELLRQPD